ncbi:MAG TPA: nitrate- and nitrite sensing domain-containing protein [Streptomyces sp.]|nr:nitrate- and nitrite sensing domain-containing protein [Streptomyces sp.]
MPTRLNAILLIPVLVALVFGGFRVSDSVNTWNEAEDAQATARLVKAAADYSHAVMEERDRTAAPLLKGDRDDPTVQAARQATDRAKERFDAAVEDMPDTAALRRRLKNFREAEPKLQKLRKVAYTDKLGGVQTEEGYVQVQHPLMEFANELGFGTGNVTSYGRSVYAIALAKGAESLQRSIGTHLLVRPGPTAKDKKLQLTALASYRYLEGIATEEYVSGGRAEEQNLLKKQVAKAQQAAKQKLAQEAAQAKAQHRTFVAPPSMDDMVKAIASGASADALKAKGITPETWYTVATARFDAYRAVEKELTDRAVRESAQIASDAKREAITTGAIVLVALLLAFALAGFMARTMGHSMRSLRTAAFDVAEQRLPALVDQLSRNDPGRVDTRVAPIPIDSRDEIGEVARAFDQVHREAVRLAAEQALLRGNVNAIFTNLSQRNQGLIERQLALITELENNEADPDQLQNLFRMDHLATRMRRNGENLLVLAGQEIGRTWHQPVPLVDILRAASSEVEHYERIVVTGVPDSEIHGEAVTDLVHLLAELLENATTFSSPQTRVEVAATRLPDGRVMIEIHDKGIGLTAEDFADINHKLAAPPAVDAAVSRRMGLFVVGRLAARHGVRVQLRPSGEQSGTTSLVMLPDVITHGGGGEDLPEEEFHVSRIVPEQPSPAQYQLDSRSAAELGFDDSRYDSRGPAAAEPPEGPYAAHTGQQPAGAEAESHTGVPDQAQDHVGFDRPGPSPSGYRSVTGAGLPRRDLGRAQHEEGPVAQFRPEPESGEQPQRPVPPQPGPEPEPRWSSPNDESWDRAGRLREPQAGGVTDSGLPRRVPRANLVAGAAEQTRQGGPQVSRAPEDVRGRLSNLHRGVRRGRSASDADHNDRQGFGPGSTYDQER